MRVCFFGDSFVNGTGDDDCLGWVGRLCALGRKNNTDITCYNLGVRRDTSADIARRWRGEAEARLPDEYDGRLLFSFGANDSADGDRPEISRVPLAATLNNARAILSSARAWKPTLMVGPLPVSVSSNANTRIALLAARLEGLCAEIEVPFLNFLEVAESMKELWQRETDAGDGVHPNRGAYTRLAETVSQWTAWQKWMDSQ